LMLHGVYDFVLRAMTERSSVQNRKFLLLTTVVLTRFEVEPPRPGRNAITTVHSCRGKDEFSPRQLLMKASQTLVSAQTPGELLPRQKLV